MMFISTFDVPFGEHRRIRGCARRYAE